MRTQPIPLLLLAALLATPLPAQKPGTTPPPLGLETLLQAPEGSVASWKQLRGRVVVLEFWATWCAPCVGPARIHLNELADELTDRDITFLAITDQTREVVEPFLARFPMKAWVGLDTDASLFRSLNVQARPVTVVVGKDGKVLGRLHPMQLSADHLRRAARGETPGFPQPAAAPDVRPAVRRSTSEHPIDRLWEQWGAASHVASPNFELTWSVIEGSPSKRGRARGRAHVAVFNEPLRMALAVAAGVRPEQVLCDDTRLDRTRVSLRARVPEDARDQLLPLVLDSAARTFGIRLELKMREQEVLVLSALPSARDKLEEAEEAQSLTSEQGSIEAYGVPIWRLTHALEGQLQAKIANETDLEGNFAFELQWDPDDREDLQKQLRRDYGLVLRTERRAIPCLEPASVSPTGRPSSGR